MHSPAAQQGEYVRGHQDKEEGRDAYAHEGPAPGRWSGA